ncbi:unnamed protein product [Coccothraustes coccothraustes]
MQVCLYLSTTDLGDPLQSYKGLDPKGQRIHLGRRIPIGLGGAPPPVRVAHRSWRAFATDGSAPRAEADTPCSTNQLALHADPAAARRGTTHLRTATPGSFPTAPGRGAAPPTDQLAPGFPAHAQQGLTPPAAPLPRSAVIPTGAAIAPAPLLSTARTPAASSSAAEPAEPAGDISPLAPPPPASPAPIRDASCIAEEVPKAASPLPACPPPATPFRLPGNTDGDNGQHQQPVPQQGRVLAAGGRPDRAAKSEDRHSPGIITFPVMEAPWLCGVPAMPWSTPCVPLLFAGWEEWGPERLWFGPCPGQAGEGWNAGGMAETLAVRH